MQNQNDSIVLPEHDYERLLSVINCTETDKIDLLWKELVRSVVLPKDQVASNIVTMNSEVVIEDKETKEQLRLRLVYPKNEELQKHEVCVLSPIGMALLGLKVGQEFACPDKTEKQKKMKILAINFQPEAHGLYFL